MRTAERLCWRRLGLARSTLALWVGQCRVQLQPLVQALREELPRRAVLHADETPVAMLKPGADSPESPRCSAYKFVNLNVTA